MRHRTLFVGTDRAASEALTSALEPEGFEISWCDADTAFDPREAAVVVATPACARRVQDSLASTELPPVMMICGDDAPATAAALNVDYLSDIRDPAVVLVRLRQAIKHRALLEARRPGFEGLVGASPAMAEVYRLIERAAPTSSSVLITGESGTGKELVARALHARSRRHAGPLVAVNCSSFPENLLESELFGHRRGAFTDARVDRTGLFVRASGGTLFLDEIGDMPPALQPKILRALQERSVRPVGGDVEIAVDVRVIAATNHNLEQAVAERRFREDLYYRLNVIHIPVSPLRERVSDIPALALRFAAALGKPASALSPAVAERLTSYNWPGNVRELQNCIERALAVCRGDELRVDDLPPKIRDYRRSHVLIVSTERSELLTLDEVERRYIVEVLDRVDGNKKAAAQILGIDRKTLYRKLDRYGLEPSGD